MVSSKALVTRVRDGKAQLMLEEVALNGPQPDQVLVQVQAVAQNPTDVQALDNNAFGEGIVLGCDFVGRVQAKGADVQSLQQGDVIAGLIWGGEIPGVGGYSEYTYAVDKINFKVPPVITLVEAATIPLACTTAWLAMFSSRCLGIKRDDSKHTSLLIWGGSSSVGQFAIQLAKLYSIPTVATCSPKHFDTCKSLGATWVFDYKDENVVEDIKAKVPGIVHVFDCIGSGTSSTRASQTVDQHGGKLCTVRPGKANTEGVERRVEVSDVLVWTAFLKDHQYKEFEYPASKEDHDLAIKLFNSIPGWLEDGKLKPNKAKVLPGGLSAVKEGFQLHRDGNISGYKIVYEL